MRRKGLPHSPLLQSSPVKAPVELCLSAGVSPFFLAVREKVNANVLIAFMVNFCNSISLPQLGQQEVQGYCPIPSNCRQLELSQTKEDFRWKILHIPTCCRLPMDSIPKEQEASSAWLIKLFQQKDQVRTDVRLVRFKYFRILLF